LLENVPQVVSDENIDDFHAWNDFLSELGYKNYGQILNAKDYGVAQNRERFFQVSILGDYNYKFPQPIPLEKTMKDYLEQNVDEKYYINSEKAQQLIAELVDSGRLDKGVSSAVRGGWSRLSGQTPMGYSCREKSAAYMNYRKIEKVNADTARTICARDYKGFGTGNETMNGVIEHEQQD